MIDWNQVKSAYITEFCTMTELARRFGVHISCISKHAGREGWRELREKHRKATLDRALDLVEQAQAEKLARMEQVSGRLLDRVEEAISQLDVQILREVHKDRDILYENDQRPDKPTRETTVEREVLSSMKIPVDRNGIKLLAAALKDIKEVQMIRTAADVREQEAKINKLLGEANQEEPEERGLEVLFSSETEALAE